MAINKDEKEKALNQALLQIQKQYGQGSIMMLGDEGAKLNKFEGRSFNDEGFLF